jgi:Domain of Unknown Function (DUF1080)
MDEMSHVGITGALIGITLLAGRPGIAKDQDFNGRWDLTAVTQPRPKAWWLELIGVGSAEPTGRFVSAYNGDMNTVSNITLVNGEIRFTIDIPGRKARAAPSPVYRAHLVDGRLEGTVATPGTADAPVKWTGVRAPVIADKDDGSWRDGTPVPLFNGRDLSGWTPLNPGAEMKWIVRDGILRNAPHTTDIVSDRTFWNFKVHVDFRIVPDSNSGIGLRGRYEIQILDDYGKPPNIHGAGALYSRVAPSVNASKPAGEWQSYDIRLVGRTLTVVYNGTTVLNRVEVEGLTAIANNSDESRPGPFIVQGDHGSVEIKSFVVIPLVKK